MLVNLYWKVGRKDQRLLLRRERGSEMSWLSKLTGGGDAKPATAGSGGGKDVPRPTEPPLIIIDHHEFSPEEFAFGSFRIRPYEGDLIPKQHFDFRMSFTLSDALVEFACHGVVVKSNAQTGLVARYVQPQPFYERKLIEYLRLWKGA